MTVSLRRPLFTALATASVAVLLATATALAAVPSHGGTFDCSYDAAGNRIVRAQLPRMKSFTSGEQVYWYAAVFRDTSAGQQFVGYTRGSKLATGWANRDGVVTGAFAAGSKWIDHATNQGLQHGGALLVGRKGTYRVAGYFWWSSFSTTYTGTWATNFYTGGHSCVFGS